MELITKFRLFSLILALQISALGAVPTPIRIENRRDYEVLDRFFKMSVFEEEYGYVLEGVKPISVRNFYLLDQFPIAKDLVYAEREFLKTLLVREVLSVWSKTCSRQKNFALKILESKKFGLEIQFINISKLREVIDKNINLFQYILGPTIQTEQLINRIAYSKEPLIVAELNKSNDFDLKAR